MQLRFNGTAPAWPHLLGTEHPFYPVDKPESLGSASYSIIKAGAKPGVVDWEILIDAGHNTVPVLLQNGNRIPDVMLLTHGHPDHVLGMEWIVQSLRFSKPGKKLPLYCSKPVYDTIMHTYGHCSDYIDFRELVSAETILIPETPGMELIAYPVYHGKGALGAMAVFLRNKHKPKQSVLITGDLLCPLFRKKDFSVLRQASKLIIDTNNLYSYPASNHISFSAHVPELKETSPILRQWTQSVTFSDYLEPHQTNNMDEQASKYFEQVKADYQTTDQLPHSIIDFLNMLPIPEVYLVHYFGKYDEIHYNRNLLGSDELELWATGEAENRGIIASNFIVPEAGQYINL